MSATLEKPKALCGRGEGHHIIAHYFTQKSSHCQGSQPLARHLQGITSIGVGTGGQGGYQIIAHCFTQNSAQICIDYHALMKCMTI